jgi:hypothetical protein
MILLNQLVSVAILTFALSAAAQQGMEGMQTPKQQAAPSSSLVVSVAGKAATFSVDDLAALPQKTVKVHNEHTKADESYTGPSLGDVLAKAGYVPAQASHRQFLQSYIRAEGKDQYWVLYSLVEVEPSDHTGDVIVATAVDGHGLGADGQLKLVSTEDKKPQRWVRNLAAITVKRGE